MKIILITLSLLLITWCSINKNNSKIDKLNNQTSTNQSIITTWINNSTTNYNPKDIKVIKDIEYWKLSTKQKIDIYFPLSSSWKTPAILAIHGWGFTTWNKNNLNMSWVFEWLNKWYAVFSIWFRLTDETTFSWTIKDIQNAIQFIKSNSQKYNINSNKLIIWWRWSGWYLASMIWTMWESSKNTNVQVVIDWYWLTNFGKIDDDLAQLGIKRKIPSPKLSDSGESKFIWRTIWSKEAEILINQANPENYISKNDPAFFIQHWTADNILPLTQAQNFATKLEQILWKEKVYFEAMQWAWHWTNEFNTRQNIDKIFEFIEKQLK